MHTRVHVREEKTGELRGRQRSSCYKGCSRDLGGKRPYLCQSSLLPATHSQVLPPRLSSVRYPAAFLRARDPYGFRQSLHTRVPIPCRVVNHPGSHPCLWPHPSSHYSTAYRPYPHALHPSPHPATHNPCSPAMPAGRSYPCPSRNRAGSLVHGSALGLVRPSDA